jgi:hypothetical protein
MRRFATVTLWLAGILAVLGAFGIARLNFSFLFIQGDALMLVVGAICLVNAYFRR